MYLKQGQNKLMLFRGNQKFSNYLGIPSMLFWFHQYCTAEEAL